MNDCIENLISAVIDYGEENFWDDSEIIDALLDLGLEDQDFADNQCYDICRKYFAGE